MIKVAMLHNAYESAISAKLSYDTCICRWSGSHTSVNLRSAFQHHHGKAFFFFLSIASFFRGKHSVTWHGEQCRADGMRAGAVEMKYLPQ